MCWESTLDTAYGKIFPTSSSGDCMSISYWSRLGPASQFNFTQEVIPCVYSDSVNHLENQSPTHGNHQEFNFQSLLLLQTKMLKEDVPNTSKDTILLSFLFRGTHGQEKLTGKILQSTGSTSTCYLPNTCIWYYSKVFTLKENATSQNIFRSLLLSVKTHASAEK